MKPARKQVPTSALGQKRTSDSRPLMSVLPPKADIGLNIYADPGRYFSADVERLITGRGANEAGLVWNAAHSGH
jgi:hypothetical protein